MPVIRQERCLRSDKNNDISFPGLIERGMKEIIWANAFPDSYSTDNSFYWSSTSGNKSSAMEAAEARQEELQAIRSLIEEGAAGTRDVYVKLTMGSKAGTIAKITKFPKLVVNGYSNGWRQPVDYPDKVEIRTHSYGTNDASGNCTLAGYLMSSSGAWEASVDGKPVLEWYRRSSPLKTARPVLLLDYDGPEVFLKGKPVKTKPSVTIKDRYNREVGANDLVIIGHKNDGTLTVGKVTHISDSRTVKIKHIGATTEMEIRGVLDEQVLLLSDDIKQVLMVEKLKNL